MATGKIMITPQIMAFNTFEVGSGFVSFLITYRSSNSAGKSADSRIIIVLESIVKFLFQRYEQIARIRYICTKKKKITFAETNVRMDKRRITRILLWALPVIAVAIIRHNTSLADFYAVHIYPSVSGVLSFLSQVVRISFTEITVLAFILVFVTIMMKALKKGGRIRVGLISTLKLAAVIYTWFYLGWGICYSRSSLPARAGVQVPDFDSARFTAFLYEYSTTLDSLYALTQTHPDSIPDSTHETESDTSQLSEKFKPRRTRFRMTGYGESDSGIKAIEDGMKQFYANVPARFGLAKPREWQHVKRPLLNRLYSGCGVTGFMGPFWGESQVNLEVWPVSYPFTLMHEYSHLLGTAVESEANWWAFQACNAQPDPSIRYSAYYSILPYVWSNARTLLEPDAFTAWAKTVNPEIIEQDRKESEFWQQRRFAPLDEAQSFIYNLYLKGNGIPSGTRNYSEVVALLMAIPCVNSAE